MPIGEGNEHLKESTDRNTNDIWLHNENGITHLRVNGTDIYNVADYKVTFRADDETELTFTVKGRAVIIDAEIGLKGTTR